MNKAKIRKWLVGEDRVVKTKDEWIEKKLREIPAGKSILDAGAGELKWKLSCAHLQYTSQDFAQYDGQNNVEGLQIEDWKYPHIDIVSDITDIPVEDESYDAVLCSEVFEHVPDPNMALRELVRITKIDGKLILTAPFISLTHMAPYHFCTGFNKYWYKDNLEKYGCIIEECKRSGNYYASLRQEVLRIPTVMKKYGNKNSLLVRLKCYWFARFLNQLTVKGDKAGELLCFQYLIVAKRVR